LTTIVLQDSLWETIWSNILEGTAPDPADFPSIFPWLGKTRTSESDQKTTPKHMHPFHAYWGMPRRIRVRFEPEPGRCDSCGRQSTSLARAYRAKNFGFNYSGAGWKHPLSPHRRDKKSGDWITLKGKARGFRYSDWLPLICKTEDVEPAKVIETFRENRSEAADFRIWACGFETDNMKVLGWGEGAIPVLNVSSDLWSDYVSVIRSLVAGAEYALRSLLHALKRCRGDHADGVHRLTGMAAATVEAGFWNETQPDFLEFCARVRDSTSHPDLQDLRRSWGRLLRKHAAKSFNVHSQTGAFAAVPPGRIAKAWNSLQRELAEGNPLFRKILGLPLIRKGEKV
jgi:CRISPR system Cascade subunit CasA